MKLQAHIFVLILICLLTMLSACRKSLYDVPYPSEITKTHRESIGSYIQNQLRDQEEIETLAKTTENASAFQLIQSLYDQVTNVMRLDNKSPDSNKWTRNRQWQVYILNEMSQRAFVLPGGDLYISKGLLTSLRSEAELYSILATEAILMNDKYLLKEMIIAYSTRTLVQMADGDEITDSRVETIYSDLPMFSYDFDASEAIKAKVTQLICETSLYDPEAVLQLVNRLSKGDQWSMTRPIGITDASALDCGKLETRGLYQSMVLGVL